MLSTFTLGPQYIAVGNTAMVKLFSLRNAGKSYTPGVCVHTTFNGKCNAAITSKRKTTINSSAALRDIVEFS